MASIVSIPVVNFMPGDMINGKKINRIWRTGVTGLGSVTFYFDTGPSLTFPDTESLLTNS